MGGAADRGALHGHTMLRLQTWDLRVVTDEHGRYVMAVPGDGSGPSEGSAKEPGAAPAGGGETVLVVDDDPAVLQVASKVLSRGGYQVLEATSGADALRIAEEHEGQLDLLLTDVVMPGMGGREVSEAMAQRFPRVRILFMSAYTEDEVILQGVRVAEVNFISKPFTVQGLRSKVREVLDHDFH